jgi:hypothetical protein
MLEWMCIIGNSGVLPDNACQAKLCHCKNKLKSGETVTLAGTYDSKFINNIQKKGSLLEIGL